MALGAPISGEDNWEAFRIRMFLEGHTFDYIDSMSVADVGKTMTYLSVKSKAEDKSRRKNTQRRRH